MLKPSLAVVSQVPIVHVQRITASCCRIYVRITVHLEVEKRSRRVHQKRYSLNI
jgi:hypothetical protein